MARYIDAEKRKGELEEYSKWRAGKKCGIDFIPDCALPKTPTADVQEVKHGKWIVWGMFDDLVKCSCCGYEDTLNHVSYESLRYCGRCGAKMGEDEKQ